MRPLIHLLLIISLAATAMLSFSGCGDVGAGGGSSSPPPGNGGDTGVTVGGAQDMAYARSLINDGQVPEMTAFTYEGCFSEYDLPVAAEMSNDGLLRAGAAQAYQGDDRLEPVGLFLHLAFAADEDAVAETMARDLDISIVLDVSGSMSSGLPGEYGTSNRKIDLAKQALHDLLTRLDDRDRIGITLFNEESWTHLEPTYADDIEAIQASISSITSGGSTNIAGGLERGLQQFDSTPEDQDPTRRVVLFTDALPNVGATDGHHFRQQVEAAATEGIGLTVFGVGLDQDFELATYMANTHGGNYRNLTNSDEMREVFTSIDFDYLMHPLAYDLQLELEASDDVSIIDAFGIPGRDERYHLIMDSKTLFLSRNRGAILLQLTPRCWQGAELGSLLLSYRTPAGDEREHRVDLSYNGPDEEELPEPTPFAEGDGTRLALLLTRYVRTLREACHRFHDGETADTAPADMISTLIEVLQEEQAHFASEQLTVEVDTAIKLWENMTGEEWEPAVRYGT